MCIIPGETYYLQVDGFNGQTSMGNLAVNPFSDADSCCQDFALVPTLSEWSVIIVALLLLIMAIVSIKEELSVIATSKICNQNKSNNYG